MAISEPQRRRMLELLGRGPMAAGEIAGEFALSAPAVSQHLKVLRDSGLVRVEIAGQRRIYSLDPIGLAEVEAWIGKVRRDWKARLDRLEAELAREKGDRQ